MEEVPNLMCESLKDDSLIKNIEVTIHSSIVPEGIMTGVTGLRIAWSLILLLILLIPFLRENNTSLLINMVIMYIMWRRKTSRNNSSLNIAIMTVPSQKKNDMLQNLWTSGAPWRKNYDIYFKTSKNTYKLLWCR